MEETVFETQYIMCALTDEYIKLQDTYGKIVNDITRAYDIPSTERSVLSGEFGSHMTRLLWLGIGANITFFDVGRIQNIIATKTMEAAKPGALTAAIELSEAKIHLKSIENLLASYDQVTATALSEIRTLLTNYGTMDGKVLPSELVVKGIDKIIGAIETYISCDGLTSATEKCFNELYETVVSEYGEVVKMRWSVASQFYGNYVSVIAIVESPIKGSIH